MTERIELLKRGYTARNTGDLDGLLSQPWITVRTVEKHVHSISRIEGGQHATTARTLKKLAEALDARAVLGIEFGSAKAPERQLVVL